MPSTRHRLRARPGDNLTIQRKPPVTEATLHGAIMPLLNKLCVGKPASERMAGVLHRAIKRDMASNPVYALMRDWTPVVVIAEDTGKVAVYFVPPQDHDQARH